MSAPAAALFADHQADLFAPGAYPDQPSPYTWRDDDADSESARQMPAAHSPERDTTQPAPAPALAIVPRRTLRDRINGVDLILETIEALDDEALTPELRDELSAQLITELAGTRAKVDATAGALATFEALESAAAREIERLKKRQEMYSRQRARLEDYVLATLEASQLKKIEGDISTLTSRANPPRVEVDDVHALPREFQRYAAPPPPPPPTADKPAIAKALKANREIPGARLVQSARLVRS